MCALPISKIAEIENPKTFETRRRGGSGGEIRSKSHHGSHNVEARSTSPCDLSLILWRNRNTPAGRPETGGGSRAGRMCRAYGALSFLNLYPALQSSGE